LLAVEPDEIGGLGRAFDVEYAASEGDVVSVGAAES
jgi:hypothetical protein